MYLEGDALDLFTWINAERIILYWEELVKDSTSTSGTIIFEPR